MSVDPVRLPVVSEHDASGETAAIYQEIHAFFGLGFVPDVFRLTSTRPTFLRTFWDGYRSMFAEGVVDRETKELIAAWVARDAGCRYCVDAHLLLLELIAADQRVVDAARSESIEELPVEPRVRALLHFVHRMDTEAYRITDDDVARLRSLGWTDDELLECIWTACLFNGIVRLVDTFGLYRLGQLDQSTDATTPQSS